MSGHGHAPEGGSKKIALLITVLGLFFVFSEIYSNDSQAVATAKNIEASNLWSFFQAKTIRRQVLQTNAEQLEVNVLAVQDPVVKEAMQKRIESWKAAAARMESEPETREGRKELMARALVAEKARDLAVLRKEHYELAAALLQLGIVLASAMVITGMTWLGSLSGLLGIFGIFFMTMGRVYPTLIHFPWAH
jgi:Domain of unknown function (DUF4337)